MEDFQKCPRCGRIYNDSNLIVCINCGSDLCPGGGGTAEPEFKKSVGLFSAYANMFKNWRDYRSRSTRKEFWFAYLVDSIVQLALLTILMVINFSADPEAADFESYARMFMLVYNIMYVYMLVSFVARLPLMIRRLRDAGYKPTFILFNFIPLAGPFIILIFMAKRSVAPDFYDGGENNGNKPHIDW